MTSPRPHVVNRAAETGGRAAVGDDATPAACTGQADMPPSPPWMRVLPPLVALGVMIWGIRGPSYWRDESATLSAVQRPFSQLLRMLGNIDVVHGAYYVVMWPLVRLAGSAELVTRLPSLVATVVAAAFITGLGRRLVSPRAGLAAGLVFAILPQISLYGQDARPYAMTTALAAAASYLLVRALDAAACGSRTGGWLVGYAACLGVLGNLHPFALLLIAAHAVPVALSWLRRGDAASGRSLALGWVAAVAGGVVLAGPILVLGYAQHGSLSWLKAHGLASVGSLVNLIGPWPMAAAAGAAVLCALAVAAGGGWARLRAAWPGGLLALCIPWLILPAAILLGISMFSPAYTFRYVVFCAPAAALLVGAALATLGWAVGAAALAIIIALGVPAQLQVRSPNGHGTNIRRLDQIVAKDMRPGDVLLYTQRQQNFTSAYAYGLRQLPNIAQAQTPVQAGALVGTELPRAVVRQRLRAVTRVWSVQPNKAPHSRSLLRGLGFRLVRVWHLPGLEARLYKTVRKRAPMRCSSRCGRRRVPRIGGSTHAWPWEGERHLPRRGGTAGRAPVPEAAG